MPHAVVVDLARSALITALLLAGPLLLVALGVGLIISVIQAVTQIQEQTLAFVPKLLALGAIFLLALPWSIHVAMQYTIQTLRMIPALAN